MNNKEENIDKIIRDKLFDFEEKPSPLFWNKLSRRLNSGYNKSVLLLSIPLIFALLLFLNLNDDVEPDPALNINNSSYHIQQTQKINEFEEDNSNEEMFNHEIQEKEIPVINSELDTYQSESPKHSEITTLDFSQINDNTEIGVKSYKHNISQLTTYGLTSLSNNYSNTNIIHLQKEDVEFINVDSRFSISFEVGVEMPMRKLTSDDNFNDFLQYRNENEKLNPSLSYGLLINYQHNNFTITSGFRINSIIESLSYEWNKMVIDPNGGYYDIDTVSITVYDENNNPEPIILGYNRTWVDEYSEVSYNVNARNEFTYIEIPINMGYSIVCKQFCITPNIGAGFGFLYRASGTIPVPDSTEFINISDNQNYLNKFIPSLSCGVKLQYQLTPKYRFYLEPNYKHSLKSMYSNQYPLKANYSKFGVRFGITVDL
jgi:hypothetical protein